LDEDGSDHDFPGGFGGPPVAGSVMGEEAVVDLVELVGEGGVGHGGWRLEISSRQETG